MDTLTFQVLGPVTVLRGTTQVPLRSGVLVSLLAALLTSMGRPVSQSELVEFVWGEQLPQHPRAALQSAMSRLRRRLGAEVIDTVAAGYCLPVASCTFDLLRFEHCAALAGQAESVGDLDIAIGALQDALDLWQEPLLSNVEAPGCGSVVATLTERYLALIENWAQLCLRAGRYQAVIQRLSPLAQEQPFRERLIGQLMTALFHAGRQAEALTRYERVRELLADKLGVDPDRELQKLHLRILRADAGLAIDGVAASGSAVIIPRQLPAGAADFTGRKSETAAVCDALVSGDRAIVVISGPSSVGKTALAVHCAQHSAAAFPDGQLYVDLHSAGSHHEDAHAVMATFLRSLGVANHAIPQDAEERLALYRSILADRRVLITLDNAENEAEVRPLLPGGLGCAVIVTSRSRLGALPGAMLIDLDVFDVALGMELLRRISGAERISSEAAHAQSIVRHCGGLPLALRIAGARLAARPHLRVAQLAERLADTRSRLDELTYGDLDVRASMSKSYYMLSAAHRTLLRRLSLLDATCYTASAGAALMDVGLDEAQDLLDELVDARLVDTTHGRTQYMLRDLVRVYAQERAALEEGAPDCDSALARARR